MADENQQQSQDSTPMPADSQSKPEGAPPEGYLPQDKVNEIVQHRLAREREQFNRQLTELGFESIEDVKKLKTAQSEREKQDLAEREQYKELAERIRQEKDEEIRKRDEELTGLRSRFLDTQAERTLIEAATAHNVVAPKQVAQLVRNRVQVDDDGNVFVTDGKGNRATNGKGEDLSVDAFMSEFISSNPHFQRAASGQGAGGRPPSGGGAPESYDLAKLRANPKLMQDPTIRAEVIAGMKAGKIKG